MPRHFRLLTIAVTLGLAIRPALAATAFSPQPIDALRDKLFNQKKGGKKTKLTKLQRLKASVLSKNYSDIRRSAESLRGDPLFSDLSFLYTASSYRDECSQRSDKQQFNDAIKAGLKGMSIFLEAEAKFPYSPSLKHIPDELALSELAIAEGYYGKKDFLSSEQYFERAFQRLTVSGSLTQTIRPLTLEHYGKACVKKSQTLCQAWAQRLASTYPRISQEGRVIAQYFSEAFEKAHYGYGNGKATLVYKGPDADQASFDGAFALFVDGRYSNAIKAFNQFLEEFPKSAFRYRARYWLAECFEKDRQHDRAQKALEDLVKDSPLTYYGLLASLGAGTSLPDLFKNDVPAALPEDRALWPVELVRLKRAERFITEGLTDFASAELREFKPRDALSSPFILYLSMLNFEVGNFSTAFGLIQELINRNFDGIFTSYGLGLIFPVAYKEIIQKHSYQAKLDPILVISLIKQESAFDSRIASNVGASGLMQLMPTTASETEAAIRRADLIDPDSNIRVGTKYLKQLLNRYNGNIALTLAAYNAGPGAVDRWMREGRGKNGLQEFIELIPYRETREYVASIIRNYFWYARKMGAEIPKDLGYFWSGPAAPSAPTQPEPMPSSAPQGVPPSSPFLDDTA